jgi:PAS domain S-box-containing protein
MEQPVIVKKPLILIIDDTPANLLTLGGMLAPDYEVSVATSGAAGLALAQQAAPDLILLDVMMTEMDGYETCRRLKQNESVRNVPVIFITARGDYESEARCFAEGAVDFVTKPINLPVLLVRIKTHLAQYDQRRSLEAMFHNVVEFTPDAFILASTEGQIVSINARAELLFGYEAQELIGQPVEVLIPPSFHASHINHRKSYLQSHILNKRPSVMCRHRSGSEFPADISLSPLQTDRGMLMMAVVRDVSERRNAQLALEESSQRLRELAAQNEATREADKKHIAREVHDELGQVLTALRMDISLLGMRFGSLDPALTDKVQGMKALVDRAIQGVRTVAKNLRPAALDMGLVPAIEWLCSEFTKYNNIACLFHVEEENIGLNETRAVVVFRIVQESLTNISRYANASQVDITLSCHENELRARVRDNGLGFDLQAAMQKKSLGLLGMRERALALGGLLDITSAPGKGTEICLSIPIKFDRRRTDHDSTADR